MGEIPKIEKYLDQNNHTQAWIVCMTSALFFFYVFIQVTKFNAIGNSLSVDLNLNATKLGALSSAYFWGNLVFLVPAGMLLDRFSTKKILTIVFLMVIISTFVFSFTTNIQTAFICLFLVGISGAFALTLSLRLASRWFPPEKMALVTGLIVSCGFAGAMVSQTPLIWLVNQVGWRDAMRINALLGLILLCLTVLVIKDSPYRGTHKITYKQTSNIKSIWRYFKQSITNSQSWLFGFYTCVFNFPIFIFGAAFGISYLQQVHQLSQNQAASIMIIMFLGCITGSPFVGWVSDKIKSRRIPMIISGLISIILILAIMYIPNLMYLSEAFLFFALGFFTTAQNITYTVITESSSEQLVGTNIGMVSMLIMSGGAIFLPFFGWLLDFHHTVITPIKFTQHSASDYLLALWMLPIVFMIGIITVIFGKETYHRKS